MSQASATPRSKQTEPSILVESKDQCAKKGWAREPDIGARLGSQGNVHGRLGPRGGQSIDPRNEVREERRATVYSRRTNSIDKPQGIPCRRSPPIRHTSRTAEEVSPCKLMMKSIRGARIVEDTSANHIVKGMVGTLHSYSN
ncbi:hypothetical protein L3X38_042564 [Prunus dulcis]|uniref:Uncharacterized protein n=1 Tax=Prunus dulcis TaxID=3755 RepID=A0AAD4YLF8_PRUDU|nr:hypothetical protein L3X38_042564 [Prunus dulcis]